MITVTIIYVVGLVASDVNLVVDLYSIAVAPSSDRVVGAATREPYLFTIYFGHWHISRLEVMNGTAFRCIGELDFVDIDM